MGQVPKKGITTKHYWNKNLILQELYSDVFFKISPFALCFCLAHHFSAAKNEHHSPTGPFPHQPMAPKISTSRDSWFIKEPNLCSKSVSTVQDFLTIHSGAQIVNLPMKGNMSPWCFKIGKQKIERHGKNNNMLLEQNMRNHVYNYILFIQTCHMSKGWDVGWVYLMSNDMLGFRIQLWWNLEQYAQWSMRIHHDSNSMLPKHPSVSRSYTKTN